MFNFDENAASGGQENRAEYPTDRVNGEYHYKNGYTQKIYSDAHYVREDENTAPPRYYTPPEKTAREPKEPSDKKPSGAAKLICLCLVCALLGGICGAGITSTHLAERVTEVEARLEELNQLRHDALAAAAAADEAAGQPDTVNAALIYDIACTQTVGITTEVTYTNFFGMSSSSAVTGSGFLVSDDGYIVTNYHVIEYAHEGRFDIEVMLHDGSRYNAQIVGVEKDNDIAVLKIDVSGLNAAAVGDSDKLSVGDTVYAVGNPLGELEFSMTTGHVSALNRLITTEEKASSINMFQIDAAVNSGNSGGPLYNSRGEVVGIVTAKYSETGVEGLGFAIPINDAVPIVRDLITKGYVTGKASLGLRLDNRYNSMYSQYYGMPLGAFVSRVEKGSCAETAGIQAGDIITQLGGEEITSYLELQKAVKKFAAGDAVDVVLYRAGDSLTLPLIFDEEKPG